MKSQILKEKITWILFYFLFAFAIAAYSILIWITFTKVIENNNKILLIILSSIMIFLVSLSFGLYIISLKRKRQNIRKYFNYNVDTLMTNSGIGMILYDENGEIYWTSQFLENRLKKSLIGTKIRNISKDFGELFIKGNKIFTFTLDNSDFEAKVFPNSNSIIIKDVSIEKSLAKQYTLERIVIGELEIDNFNQFQATLSEEDLFNVQSSIIKTLDELVEKYGIAYKQYVNGKYMIITSNATLKNMISENFNFLEKLRTMKIADIYKLTISIGFAFGSTSQKDLVKLAKDGLIQAQARGGDQVIIMEPNKHPQYFGAKIENLQTSSRVKTRQLAKTLEQKLNSKNINNVIIFGHKFADLDAVGAAIGIYDFAKSFNKKVWIKNETFDDTTKNVINKLPYEYKEIFIKSSYAKKNILRKSTLFIIVDTAELDLIENPEFINEVDPENIFIIDHHRMSKLPENIPSQNIYVDTLASSTSEIVSEVLQFSEKLVKISKVTAQQLLNGIYLDTKQFTKSLSSRTFDVAAWLQNFGASPFESVEIFKIPHEYAFLISKMLSNTKEVHKGFFLSSYDGEIPQDVISIIADEILRIKGRKAAFVIAKIPKSKNLYKMSARGIETNVQIIAEAVGGGGHFSSAAAISDEPLKIFESNIIQAIASRKEGK